MPAEWPQAARVQCCVSDFAGGESPALTKCTFIF